MNPTHMLTYCLLGASAVFGAIQDQEARITVKSEYLTRVPEVKKASPVAWPDRAIRELYYAGPEHHGKPTWVFAYMGVPQAKAGEKVPGILLIHGGGGTAYREWVELWNSRGYAAIAMDLCGCIPVLGALNNAHLRFDGSGPYGWDASFSQIHEELADQWPSYAVNAIARARTLLGAQPGVDGENIGITGISWGGYLTSLVMGVDQRYRFAIPIYGCGFLKEQSVWMDTLRKPEMAQWNRQCDPRSYLGNCGIPALWVGGTNDGAYGLESLDSSVNLVAGARRSITPRMVHGHGGPGENPEVIRVFADHHARGSEDLPQVESVSLRGRKLQVRYVSVKPLVKAVLHYTVKAGDWRQCQWEEQEVATKGGLVTVQLPEHTWRCFVNLHDYRGVHMSTPLVKVPLETWPQDGDIPAGLKTGKTSVWSLSRIANLYRLGEGSFREQDASAVSAEAVRMPASHHQWYVQLDKFPLGKHTIYCEVRCDSEAPGTAMVIGVYDNVKMETAVLASIPAKDIAGKSYHLVKIGSCDLKPSQVIFLAPQDPEAVNVWMDRMVFVSER